MNLNEFFHTLDLQVNEEIPSSGTYIHTPQNLILKPDGDSIYDDDKNNPSGVNVSKIEIGLQNDGPDEIYHFMGVYHDAGTWELYTDNGITRQLAEYFGVRDGDIDWSEQGEQQEDMMHFDIASDQIAGQLITSMNKKFTAESGIMYRAGVKKYGKEVHDAMLEKIGADCCDDCINEEIKPAKLIKTKSTGRFSGLYVFVKDTGQSFEYQQAGKSGKPMPKGKGNTQYFPYKTYQRDVIGGKEYTIVKEEVELDDLLRLSGIK